MEIREGRDPNDNQKGTDILEASLVKLLCKEEIYWKQRSRNKWLAARDRNTTFFHNSAYVRKVRNNINCLRRLDNTLTADQKEIEGIVTDYYTALFSTQQLDMANI